MTASRWLVVALALVAACGSGGTGAPDETARTGTATTMPSTTVNTTTPTTTPRPPVTTAVTTTAVAPTTTLATSTFTTVAPAGSPDQAIGTFLHPERYVGDCAATDMERDVGAYCSKLLEDRADQRIYAMGLTFSEVSFYLLVERQGGGWVVTDSAPFDEKVGVVSPW